jgi:phosphate transport system protein
MTKHFRRELEQLTRDVLVMGGLAENAVSRAMRAFLERDADAASTVIDGDSELNAMELRVEEEVLKILSLYGPTARDLRYVVGVFKITNDLERVGDLAVNIAERAQRREPDETGGTKELTDMAARVRQMLTAALDAFVSEGRERAEEVLAMDDPVDELLQVIYNEQRKRAIGNEAEFDASVRILSTAKYLERIADHATNIAEDVIYMVSGDVVKHLY